MKKLEITLDDEMEQAIELLKDLSVNYETVIRNALVESIKEFGEEGLDY